LVFLYFAFLGHRGWRQEALLRFKPLHSLIKLDLSPVSTVLRAATLLTGT